MSLSEIKIEQFRTLSPQIKLSTFRYDSVNNTKININQGVMSFDTDKKSFFFGGTSTIDQSNFINYIINPQTKYYLNIKVLPSNSTATNSSTFINTFDSKTIMDITNYMDFSEFKEDTAYPYSFTNISFPLTLSLNELIKLDIPKQLLLLSLTITNSNGNGMTYYFYTNISIPGNFATINMTNDKPTLLSSSSVYTPKKLIAATAPPSSIKSTTFPLITIIILINILLVILYFFVL